MMHPNRKYGAVPDADLGSLDTSMLVNFVLGYTPVTNMTRRIMQKVDSDFFADGRYYKAMYFCSSRFISHPCLCSFVLGTAGLLHLCD